MGISDRGSLWQEEGLVQTSGLTFPTHVNNSPIPKQAVGLANGVEEAVDQT